MREFLWPLGRTGISFSRPLNHGWKDDPLQVGGPWRWWCGQDRVDHTGASTLGPRLVSPRNADNLQLCLNHFVETYDPTIEDSYRKQVVIDQQSCMLEVLDTAGQEEYTALRDQWIRDGEGFVLVYSITSRNSFSSIPRFHSQIQRVKDSGNAGSPTGPTYLTSQLPPTYSGGPVPVMLVGNKSDKHHEREVSSQEGLALARELGCEFVEASAKNCINVEKAFYHVVRSLRKQRQSPSKQVDRRGTAYGALRERVDPENVRTYRTTEKKRNKCVIL